MERWRILFRAPPCANTVSFKRLRLEIVSHMPQMVLSVLLTLYYSYRRTYRPETYHIAQEIQKYNIPDYRPRQEQYDFSHAVLSPCLYTFSGSKRRSRKCEPFSVCGGTAVLPFHRQKTPRDKTRRGSLGRMIRQRLAHVHQDTRLPLSTFAIVMISLTYIVFGLLDAGL